MVEGAVDRERNRLDWAIASMPADGESECGDKGIVISSHLHSLIAVVDGVGHGPQAALAASEAIDEIRNHATESLPSLIKLCHKRLQNTRGVAIGLASLRESDGIVTWVGIGNVQGRVVREGHEPGASMMLSAGIAGHQLPKLRPTRLRLGRGDLLLMATDGLREGFADSFDSTGSVRDIADRILEDSHRSQDDSLLLVVRYLDNRL
jgi:phosphoserine phosphatase RsbX